MAEKKIAPLVIIICFPAENLRFIIELTEQLLTPHRAIGGMYVFKKNLQEYRGYLRDRLGPRIGVRSYGIRIFRKLGWTDSSYINGYVNFG